MPATHIPISTLYPSFHRTPVNVIPTPNDQPPAYTSHSPPSYSLANRNADRGNYAFAIMQHNLRFNLDADIDTNHQSEPVSAPVSTTSSGSGTATSPPPEPLPCPTPEVQPPRTTRAQKAALRNFEATQNPELWGRRVGHGRHARLIRDENQGFWAWLGGLLIDEERASGVVWSAGSPWGMIGVTGHV